MYTKYIHICITCCSWNKLSEIHICLLSKAVFNYPRGVRLPVSDVVIQAKLRVTQSATRESSLRLAGSLDRIAAMDPKESGVTLGYSL